MRIIWHDYLLRTSSGDGVGSPDGWLCATMIAAAGTVDQTGDLGTWCYVYPWHWPVSAVLPELCRVAESGNV